ncbi:hypothetical protein TrST_g12491 [Triparma strigata]|uniref:C2 domain-containing protein n=1 Tax=Triparma strigata TaxID=1606541 RepID=A0A9W7B233_9STRA|nr:hypothetical protein TrST_g12491 [Triparma strigata]
MSLSSTTLPAITQSPRVGEERDGEVKEPESQIKHLEISTKDPIFYRRDSPYAISDPKHVYVSKYDAVAHHAQTKEEMKHLAQEKWVNAMAVKKMAMWMRKRLRERTRLKPVVKNLKSLKEPKEISKWEGQRSYLCDRCMLPCPGADVTCEHCNIVLHESCLTEEELREYRCGVVDTEPEPEHAPFLGGSPPSAGSSSRSLGSSSRSLNNFVGGGGGRRRTSSPTQQRLPEKQLQTYTCGFCKQDTEADQHWFTAEKKRLWEAEHHQINAALIGRVLRGFLSRFRYKRYQRAVVRFQAMLRRYIERRKFKAYRRQMKRPMIVNVLAASDMPVANRDNASADPYVIVTVHDSMHREQTLRFDTSVKQKTLDCEWEPQNFLIPGVSGNSVLVFTVVDEEEMRDQFLGQCAVPLTNGDLWLHGGKFDVDLEDLQYIVRTHNKQEADIAYEKITPAGWLTVEIKPLCSLHSVCGPIEGPHIDVLSTITKTSIGAVQNISKVSQKNSYWGVIHDGKASFYRRFGDRTPKVVVPLSGLQVSKVKSTGRHKSPHESSKPSHIPPSTSARAATRSDRLRRSSQLATETQHKKEFSLKNVDVSSSNRQKYVFEAPTVNDSRHWYEVVDYWIQKHKQIKRMRSRSRSRAYRDSVGTVSERGYRDSMGSVKSPDRSKSRSPSPTRGSISP